MARLLVNAQQWQAIPENMRQEIIEGLQGVGSLDADDEIVADEASEPFTEDSVLRPMQNPLKGWNPLKDICKAACDATAASAAAWCAANTAGAATAACILVAEAARKKCRSRC